MSTGKEIAVSGNLKDRGSLCVIQNNLKKKKKSTCFSSTVSLQECVSSGSVEMEHAYVYIEEIR